MAHEVILSTAYFGPIQYFLWFISSPEVYIEQHESYSKQTFRNRCIIASAAGPLSLSIPVKRKKQSKTLTRDIRIDYDTEWQKMHIRSIFSCYNSSPYFEYIWDDMAPFLKRKYQFLIDLNTETTNRLIEILGLKTKLVLTEAYKKGDELSGTMDLRETISPKRIYNNDTFFSPVPYHQVFESRTGFIPNLSIIDLIFNTGKEAYGILRDSATGLMD